MELFVHVVDNDEVYASHKVVEVIRATSHPLTKTECRTFSSIAEYY